jgi:uncharacterized membrane protein YhhN
MNATAFLVLTLTMAVAALDWVAVASDRRRAEYVLKPLTMVGLIAVAATLDAVDPAVRAAVLVALLLSLAGDVFLMLPRDLFVAGLAAFLGGHLAYVVAMWILGAWSGGLLVGLAVVLVAVAAVGRPILRAARDREPVLALPVALYLGVISLMVVSAFGTRAFVVVLGAVLFYVSDAVLGWTRFVADLHRGRLAVMVTYHLGQAFLVLGLVLAS